MKTNPLCTGPSFWSISLIGLPSDRIIVNVDMLRRSVPCPQCGQDSARVHSWYRQNPLDLPWCQWPVQLVVRSRKLCFDKQWHN